MNQPPLFALVLGGFISLVSLALYWSLSFIFLSIYSSLSCWGVFSISWTWTFWLSLVLVKFKAGAGVINGIVVSPYLGFPKTNLSVFLESTKLPPRLIGANLIPPIVSVFFSDTIFSFFFLSYSLILLSVKLSNSWSTYYSLKSLARTEEMSFYSRIHEVICFFSYYFFSIINFDVSTNSSTNLLLYILVFIFFFGYSFLPKSAYKLIKTSSFGY